MFRNKKVDFFSKPKKSKILPKIFRNQNVLKPAQTRKTQFQRSGKHSQLLTKKVSKQNRKKNNSRKIRPNRQTRLETVQKRSKTGVIMRDFDEFSTMFFFCACVLTLFDFFCEELRVGFGLLKICSPCMGRF